MLLERVSNIDDLDSPASPPPDFKAFGGYWNAAQVFLKHALVIRTETPCNQKHSQTGKRSPQHELMGV
jgi:hypothetical protein